MSPTYTLTKRTLHAFEALRTYIQLSLNDVNILIQPAPRPQQTTFEPGFAPIAIRCRICPVRVSSWLRCQKGCTIADCVLTLPMFGSGPYLLVDDEADVRRSALPNHEI
jgi:hypothetical protein